MAVSSKNNYPKAQPYHAPDDLTNQTSRLNEDLAAQAKRLTQANDELQARAARLRRWTLRLLGVTVAALLLSSGAVAFAVRQTGGAAPVVIPLAEPPPNPPAPALPAGPVVQAKTAPTVLPIPALAKPDRPAAVQKASFLEALGSLSAAHLYQSHLNIGLLADGVETEIYTVAEAEQSLKGVLDMMKLVEEQHARLSKSGLDPDDQESLQQIQAVSAMLHLQIDALRNYWATGKMEHADQYHQARAASWKRLSAVMGL